MDVYIHNIKMLRCLVTAFVQHTKHKTMRVKIFTLGGLLNVHLMVVDFTHCRETDHLFLFPRSYGCYLFYYLHDCQLTRHITWECYIAKYP